MDTTISNVLLQNTLQTLSNGPLSKPFKPSERQKAETERFWEIFPSEDKVMAFFAPMKWAAASANPSKCMMLPSVTLAMVDRIYGKELSFSIVVNNIVGLFTVTKPREPHYKEAIEQTARMFVGKFGQQLSIFGMLLFFADYLTEYRSSYGQFWPPSFRLRKGCRARTAPSWAPLPFSASLPMRWRRNQSSVGPSLFPI